MAITSIKTGSSFTNLVKYNDFLGPNSAFNPSSYESIASFTLGSTGTVTFSSIPSTYAHLQIRILARHSASGNINGLIRLNGSTTSLITHYLTGDGASASASTSSRSGVALDIIGNAYSSGIFTTAIIDIHDYASTTKNKTVRLFAGFDTNGAGQVTMNSGLYNATTAVSSIDIVTDGSGFLTGSTFALYGIKGA